MRRSQTSKIDSSSRVSERLALALPPEFERLFKEVAEIVIIKAAGVVRTGYVVRVNHK